MTTLAAPALTESVVLSLPHRESVPARVCAQGDGFVDLTLLAAPSIPLAVLERAELYLEFRDGEASYRLLGGVKAIAEPLGGPLGFVESVRFLARGPAELLHRRAYVRTDYVARVFLMPVEGDGRPMPGVTLNVSGGGLLLRGLAGHSLGDELRFHLEISAASPRIAGACRVVRMTPEGFVGLQFTEIAEADRDRLINFAEQRERAARSGRRGG
jgi:hypothetical protein